MNWGQALELLLQHEGDSLGSGCERAAGFGVIGSLGPQSAAPGGSLDREGEQKASWTGAEGGGRGLGAEPVFQGRKLPTSRNQERGGVRPRPAQAPGML